tara:strand:- start:176 stop:544 length:369 start_codon:yes stop_codon:yes gene_type:complete
MSKMRGIRGATTSDSNSVEDVSEATSVLLNEILSRNSIMADDIAAALFSTTDDLNSMYPASVARVSLGWEHVALMDVQQAKVQNEVALCIRVLLLINTDKDAKDLNNVYLKGAVGLRDNNDC